MEYIDEEGWNVTIPLKERLMILSYYAKNMTIPQLAEMFYTSEVQVCCAIKEYTDSPYIILKSKINEPKKRSNGLS
jgi:hypothetical protein